MVKKIGILTGGGDCPGLNAVIRGVVHRMEREHQIEVWGSHDAFNGYLEFPKRLRRLQLDDVSGLLQKGGTILGTTNRGNPFSYPFKEGEKWIEKDVSAQLAESIRDEGIEGLICIGGDGTLEIAKRFMDTHGIPVIGVPKTIDNDVAATDYTFGFWTAVDTAMEAIDKLHTTAESHDRIMVVELMGRDAGHIALTAGLAAGADAILIPEIPYDIDKVAGKVLRRQKKKRHFSLIAVAEGAKPIGGDVSTVNLDGNFGVGRQRQLGGLAATIASQLSERTGLEARYVVLGHLQRGGSPVSFDRALATAFGVKAADLVAEQKWGHMACLNHLSIQSCPIEDGIGSYRLVEKEHPWLQAARGVGICLGDK